MNLPARPTWQARHVTSSSVQLSLSLVVRSNLDGRHSFLVDVILSFDYSKTSRRKHNELSKKKKTTSGDWFCMAADAELSHLCKWVFTGMFCFPIIYDNLSICSRLLFFSRLFAALSCSRFLHVFTTSAASQFFSNLVPVWRGGVEKQSQVGGRSGSSKWGGR